MVNWAAQALAAGVAGCLLASGLAAAAPEAYLDPLTYADDAGMRQVWQPDRPGVADQARRVQNGLSFSDISGDCWKERNDQAAVLLRAPRFAPPYAVEVSVSEFLPTDIHAQVGLIAWGDCDNYVRCTTGFTTPRFESVAEIKGIPQVVAWPLEARRKRPERVRFRIEVREHSLRTYAALRKDYWIELGTVILPESGSAREAFPRIGLIGVGGKMSRPPVFQDWREERLGPFGDDTFEGTELGPQWRLGQTARGWGDDSVKTELADGCFVLTPFSGSDIYGKKVRHVPYIAQRPPADNAWEVEARIRSFPARTDGRWWRAGILLWQDSTHLVHVSIISDDGMNHMNLEAIAAGARRPREEPVLTGGFRPRETTPVWLRMARLGGDRYRFRGSFDGKEWIELGTIEIALTDPELRLYACGDQTLREMNRSTLPVAFDSLIRLNASTPRKGGDR